MPKDRLGRPLTDLRISVTDRCSFRCVYCMPREVYDDHEYLPRSEILTYDEIHTVAMAAASLGVRRIRLTGGEPLLRRGLSNLVEMLASIDAIEDIAVTTNGQFLVDQAPALAEAGMDRVTVSLDGIDDEVVRKLIDTDVSVQTVLDGIDAAASAGLGPIRINCVVRKGWNHDQVLPLIEHFRFSGHTVRFIEFMDVGTSNQWNLEEVVQSADLVQAIGEAWPMKPLTKARPSEVADTYRFDDGGGDVGFISSVSQPFCGDCSRLRLSAEGSLYTCLFATQGSDLKALLRSEPSKEDVAEAIRSVWHARQDQYSELRGAVPIADPRIEMSYIGG
ncbi:MAG: GTP 3',8-cyclase MoaA [Acidimicrobiia bacterium]